MPSVDILKKSEEETPEDSSDDESSETESVTSTDEEIFIPHSLDEVRDVIAATLSHSEWALQATQSNNSSEFEANEFNIVFASTIILNIDGIKIEFGGCFSHSETDQDPAELPIPHVLLIAWKNERGKKKSITSENSRQISINEWIRRFRSTYNHPIIDTVLLGPMPSHITMTHVKKTLHGHHIMKTVMDPICEKSVRRAIRNLPPTKEIVIMKDPYWIHEYRLRRRFLCRNFQFLTLHDFDIPMNMFRHIKSDIINIKDCHFTVRQLNEILLAWQEGQNPKLNFMRLQFSVSEPLNDQCVMFRTKWQKAVEPSKNYEGLTIMFDVYRISRKDGSVATIVFKQLSSSTYGMVMDIQKFLPPTILIENFNPSPLIINEMFITGERQKKVNIWYKKPFVTVTVKESTAYHLNVIHQIQREYIDDLRYEHTVERDKVFYDRLSLYLGPFAPSLIRSKIRFNLSGNLHDRFDCGRYTIHSTIYTLYYRVNIRFTWNLEIVRRTASIDNQ